MTRKDYILIAEAIQKAAREQAKDGNPEGLGGVSSAADHIAAALATDNPRFDARRFIAACEA
jgi:hypothetical protein